MDYQIYPLYLPETECFDAHWINLAHVVYVGRDSENNSCFIRFLGYSINPCPEEWLEIIENEYRLIEANLKYSPDEID